MLAVNSLAVRTLERDAGSDGTRRAWNHAVGGAGASGGEDGSGFPTRCSPGVVTDVVFFSDRIQCLLLPSRGGMRPSWVREG